MSLLALQVERQLSPTGQSVKPTRMCTHAAQVSALIKELNDLLANGEVEGSNGNGPGVPSPEAVAARLSPANRAVFDLLPAAIRGDLLRERDPHGNVQVASTLDVF